MNGDDIMRRILHYVGKMDIGGMEAIIMSLYRSVDHTKWQFDFAVHSEEEGFYEKEIKKLGGRIYRFPQMRNNPLAYKKAWKHFWKMHKSEYYAFQMHTNSLANCIALKLAYKSGIEKVIVHAHSAYANKGRLQLLGDCLHKFNRLKLDKYSNTLIACSPEAAQWVFGKRRIENKKVHILKNGVDFKKYRYSDKSRNKVRKALNISNKLVFIQVGNLLFVKNHLYTLKIIKELSNYNPILLVVGEGVEKDNLINEVNNLGIQKNVIFLGLRNDVNELLSASDYYLMPSLYEGMPLSAIEAQVSGIRCFLSDSITKEVRVSNNIEFISLEDFQEWINQIKFHIEDKIDRNNVYCDKTFDINYITQEYINIIE